MQNCVYCCLLSWKNVKLILQLFVQMYRLICQKNVYIKTVSIIFYQGLIVITLTHKKNICSKILAKSCKNPENLISI
jgi:hypothetical protein